MSAKKPFYLFKNNKENGIYYAQFTDPKTGRILHRSTGSKDRDQAAVITAKWLAEGIPTKGKAKKTLADIFTFTALKAHMEKVYSSGGIDEAQAVELCKTLKKWGLVSLGISPAGAGKQDSIKCLYDFYDFDNSEYLKDKRARGASVTRNYCKCITIYRTKRKSDENSIAHKEPQLTNAAWQSYSKHYWYCDKIY